jgi:hypothetical protein
MEAAFPKCVLPREVHMDGDTLDNCIIVEKAAIKAITDTGVAVDDTILDTVPEPEPLPHVPEKCQLPAESKAIFGTSPDPEVVLGAEPATPKKSSTDSCKVVVPEAIPDARASLDGYSGDGEDEALPKPVREEIGVGSLVETRSHLGHKTRVIVLDDIAVASAAGNVALGAIGGVIAWFSSATMTQSDLDKLRATISNSENAISVSIKSLRQITAFFTADEQAQGTRIHDCVEAVTASFIRVQKELDDIGTLMWRAKREKDRDPDGGEITWMTFSFGAGYGIWYGLKQDRIRGMYAEVAGKRNCLADYVAIVDREVGLLRAEVQTWVADQIRAREAREREARERELSGPKQGIVKGGFF